jgi:hypothetical protein
VNTHSNLNITAGDTIMISNYINVLMNNNNNVILVTSNTVNNQFKSNLIKDKYIIIISNDIVKTIDEQEKNVNYIFIRNHNILKNLLNKPYLYKTYFYGLDVHLQDISKFKNNMAGVITQSEQLKNKYLDNGVTNEKIQIIEPFSYNYNFNLPERTDNEIRLVYCGTLRDEENILEIIEEFQKIHKERPEVLLKIVYGKIHGNAEFTKKVKEYIKNGVKGITFKHNLSHKDSCYEIATSDIGICWRKNGWGDNGEVSTKVKEYELYGMCICNILKDLYICTNIKSIFGMKIEKKNIIILNNRANNNNIIYVKAMSDSNDMSSLQFLIDNKQLPQSNVLLSNKYITPNYIDKALYPNYKHIHIYGKLLSHIIIENISIDKVSYSEYNLCKNNNSDIKCYKDDSIFLNNIAFIGDEFTFNSLNNITNITYISKTDIHKINVNLYDILLCESTWHGMDSSWRYAFNIYENNKYSLELKHIISKFKINKKKCIFYNKEDPTNYEKFYKSAELFDIIITTSELCVPKYKKIYPNKIIFSYPFLCNPIIHNPINNKKSKIAYYVGGFYNRFTDRMNQTSKMLKDVIKNNYKLVIINRHYFYPKVTRQINNLRGNQNKYEIPEDLKQYENPCVSHIKALQLYKSSLFHLNMNTVTNCSTMSSRRLIELLACGCNVLSNNSQSIKDLKLPIFTDIKQINYDVFNEYNINGFYQTHIKYSYISLLNKLLLLSNINPKINVYIKISCKEKTKIPEKYKNLVQSTKFDFELLINNDDYYNAHIIERLLVYPYFFNGNICFTSDKNKYFTVSNSMLNNDCIIKYHKDSNQTLFIPKI